MAFAARRVTQSTAIGNLVPVFLCPILARSPATKTLSSVRRRGLNIWTCKRQLQSETLSKPTESISTHSQLLDLPRSCPGCGAYTQAVSPDQPGFYSTNRKSVQAFVARHGSKADDHGEAEMFNRVASTANGPLLEKLGLKGRSKRTDCSQATLSSYIRIALTAWQHPRDLTTYLHQCAIAAIIYYTIALEFPWSILA